MCGIVAIYSKNKEVTPTQMERSLNSIAHRGPDGRGIYFNPSRKVALGHVRLAIMDTAGGQQPLFNEDQTLVLVANGEFYDFEKIREQLLKLGHTFKTQSDSEIALHLYESQGEEFIKKLRGEFAFILYNPHKNELLAYRDRFGIKPLYYAEHQDQILIASEIKALFAAGVPAIWDEANVYQSLHFASLENSTLYKNIYQLPPGHSLCLNQDNLTINSYWDTFYPKKSQLHFDSEAAVMEAVKAKLEESILIRTRSDVPIACYLSGGVDSSTVLGMANRLSGKKIPAFTIAFDHEDFDESALAGTMARFAQSEFHPIRVTNRDFADVFCEAIEKSDMPFYNGHAPARFILSREVKKAGYKVVLGGEGADELFAGYHFSQAALTSSLSNSKDSLLKSASTILNRLIKKPSHEILKIKNISTTLFWVARVLGFPTDLAASLMERFDHLQEFQDQGFRQRHRGTDPYRLFLKQFPLFENLQRAPFHVVLYMWMKSHFPQYVLAAERLDMAHAVELRLPFLDHELFEITKHLPAQLLYKNGLNKYLLRTMAQNDVAPEVLKKLKQPFVSPPSTLGDKNPLFTLVCDLIQSEDFKRIPFFNHTFITSMLPKIKRMNHQERAPYDPVFYYLASLAVLNKKYKIT